MNLTGLLAKLPGIKSTVDRLVEEKSRELRERGTVNGFKDFPPRDPYRQYREEQFKTETKKDYLELYENHIWFYSTVYAVASSIAQLPLKLYSLSKNGKRQGEVLDGPFYNLINRPNPFDTYYDFMESLVSYVELTGDTYFEKNHPTHPTQLYVLRPDFVTIKSSAKNLVEKYIYAPDGCPLAEFNKNEVVHIKYFHPRSELYGFSFTQASKTSAILDFEAIKFQRKFFKQGGAIDKFISIKRELSTEEYKRFKEEVLADYTGSENAHKPMVLDNDGKLTAIGTDFDKAMLKEQRDQNRDEIFSGSGVPPIMANLLAGMETYNNASTQEKAFWQNTVRPKTKKIEARFNVDIFWPLGFEVAFDFSDVAALQEDKLAKAQTAQTLSSSGVMTLDEVRAELYSLPPHAPSFAPPSAQSLFAMRDNTNREVVLEKASVSAARKLLLNLLDQNENTIFSEIKPIFDEMLDTALGKVTTIKKAESAKIKELAGSFDKYTLRLMNKLVEGNTKASAKTLDSVYSRIKGRKISDKEKAALEGKAKEAIDKWAAESSDSIVTTMKKQVSMYLDKAIKSEATMEDMVEGLQDIFQGTKRGEYPHARAIARTESTKVTNGANVDAIEASGFNAKTWISGGGPNGRPDHAAMNGVTVGINEKFVLPNGVKMDYPGDPAAPVDELVNCRCGVIEDEI